MILKHIYKQAVIDLTNLKFHKCGKEVEEDFLRYVAIDTNNHYYQINAYSGMKYKIILDNYAIETEKEINEYNGLTKEEKVEKCIYKYLKMIKDKDYQYSYKYLDQTFRTQNFDTIEKFKQYIDVNLSNYDNAKINDISKVGNVYSCRVTIINSKSNTDENKKLTMIILLQQGTDFVLSFSINE